MPLPLRIVLYPLFGIFCLVLFSFFLFPFDSLRSRIEGEIAKGIGGNYSVSITKVSPALLSGFVLKGVELRDKKRQEGIRLDRARVKVSLLPLLWGTKEINLNIKSGKGTLTGSVTLVKDGTKLDIKVKDIDLSIGRLALPPNLPIDGSLKGNIFLEIYPTDPLRNVGKIQLTLGELRLSEGATAGGFPLPSLTLVKEGKGEIVIEVVRGNWELKSFNLSGGDIDFEATGKVYAARRVKNYRLSLRGSFQPQAGSEEKIPFLGLIEAQKKEGRYPFSVTGRFSKPSVRIGTFKLPI